MNGIVGAMSEDPQQQRIGELVAKIARDDASEAEREELALYIEDNPDVEGRLRDEARTAGLGKGWLERVEADRRLQRKETSGFVKAERGVGLAATVGGVALAMAGSTVAPFVVIGGLGVLTWSFVRVRLKTFKDDPYKDVRE